MNRKEELCAGLNAYQLLYSVNICATSAIAIVTCGQIGNKQMLCIHIVHKIIVEKFTENSQSN